MHGVQVTYTVKEGRVEENEALVRAVYDKLREMAAPGIMYGTFKKDDGRTFVHLAFFESPEHQQRFGANPAFQEFQREIGDRCEVPPNAEPLDRLDSYGFGAPVD